MSSIEAEIKKPCDCDAPSCQPSPEIDLESIKTKVLQTPITPSKIISTSGTILDREILRTDELIIQENGLLKLEGNNELLWIAIVVKNLKFIGSNTGKSTFNVTWNEFDLNSLNGDNGNDGPNATKSGYNGGHGESGKNGITRLLPNIYFIVRQYEVVHGSIDDIDITFNLDGFPGGKGGDGGKGGNGTDGKNGRNGSDGLLNCKSGPGNGQDGGNGGYGGRGGNGGCGSNGPLVEIIYLDPLVYDKFISTKYSVNGGQNIIPNYGKHGTSGLPGYGGSPGLPTTLCRGKKSFGKNGKPSTADETANWHLGDGKQGLDGKDGDFLLTMSEEIIEFLFT
ncbi:MAG: hypothetical protein KDC79_13855 [Cyclobacteriaceae bacterium]|nr:hypothetical protein [Cyclobacteriaceae bacterium]